MPSLSISRGGGWEGGGRGEKEKRGISRKAKHIYYGVLSPKLYNVMCNRFSIFGDFW
jgi:hypothetical protein